MATSVNTWARLRSPIGSGSDGHSGNPAKCNVVYFGPLFLSAETANPLSLTPVRTYRNPLNFDARYPYFAFRGGTDFNEMLTRTSGERSLTDDQIDELIGQTVTYTLGGLPTSFVMTADTWTFFGQFVGTSGTLVSIGNLTLVP